MFEKFLEKKGYTLATFKELEVSKQADIQREYLSELETQVKAKASNDDITKALENFKKDNEIAGYKDKIAGLETKIATEKSRVDKLAQKDKSIQGGKVVNFKSAFAKELSDNHEDLKTTFSKNKKADFKIKATINTNNSINGAISNENGGALINQLNQGIILPAQLVNFDQLVSVVQGSEDTIRYYREATSANAVGTPTSVGALKPEVTYDFNPYTETADYTAGIYAFHKSMFRNLPWMQNRLPQMLRRDFYKTQNGEYYAKLKAEITAATLASGDDGVLALIKAIGELEGGDFPVNGITINPVDYAAMTATRDNNGSFSLPGTVTFDNGVLRVNGVPAFKATWVPQGEFIVGDWSQAYKYVTDSLNIDFSESDDKNFQKNAITSRVEESNVLVVEQPNAFLSGSLTNV